ncbi:hypothetical protein BH11MYX4_BH11MYX4_15210 [soil metagenome]
MRTLLAMKVIGTVVIAATLVACSGRYEKVPEGDVDAAQKAAAQRLATTIYEGCRTGVHAPLGADEAIPEMREALTPAKLAATCASIKGQFGEYQSLDYAETWRPGSGGLRVFRFRGHFASTQDTPEIRVVMDGQKLSGFWLKPWSDALR